LRRSRFRSPPKLRGSSANSEKRTFVHLQARVPKARAFFGPGAFSARFISAKAGRINKKKNSPRRIRRRRRLHLSIKEIEHAGEFHMAKTLNITLAFLLFAPIAFAIAMQAAHIVA
jgi:hypothetical protein